jgi:two-component system, chemotaxis family, protein-glutamate methylesterase/glutaminase
MNNRKLKVLIVDDSALVRRILTELLSADPEVEVVGAASDAYMARDKIKALNPDVITLDVEMPKMDGLTFLRNLMRLRPMPVVMVSSLTEHGAEITLDALSVGAVDYLPKPKIDLAATLSDYAEELCTKIKAAAKARVRRYSADAPGANLGHVPPRYSADAILPKSPAPRQFRTTDRIIAIGASTGGTEAIREVLVQLPADTPGIVITQHIPKAFSTPFAKRMNACCQMTVYEAEDGQQVLPGHVYIAPGDRHLLLVRDGARYVCRLDDGQPVNRHKPSVDVLFRSVAQQAGRNAIGVILTGMGKDGAEGLKEMRETGSPTIAQDEATSVVWGMPREAVAIGAAVLVLGLHEIPGRLRALAESMDVTRSSASNRV